MRYQLRHAPIDGAKLAFFFKLTNTHARQYDFLAVQTKCKPSAVLVGFNSNYETHKDLPRLCRGSWLSLCCLRPALITSDEALDRVSATFASQSGKLRGPVGCVATAMSRIRKYHNWPPDRLTTGCYIRVERTPGGTVTATKIALR